MMLRMLVMLMAKSGVITFTPLSLFANNEQGAWYDPSDLTTMFQDAAGTTPVTAAEQPVGLILDKSKGLVLGAELVVGGAGTSPTDWLIAFNGGASSITSNGTQYVFTSDATVAYAYQILATVPNTYYQVTFDVVSRTSGVYFRLGGDIGSGGIYTANNEALTGPQTFIFRVTTATTVIHFGMQAGQTLIFDNISVRELPGNHATQTTATKRPILSARVNLLTKTDNFGDAAWTKTAGATTPSANNVVIAAGANNGIYRSATVGLANLVSRTISFKIRRNGSVDQTFRILHGAVYLTADLTATATDTVFNLTTTFGGDFGVWVGSGGAAADLIVTYASLVVADQASLPYQRVNTATDYDTVGFPHYLKFDGIDDSLVTGSIDFTATDKMTVVAGVRKLSDAVPYQIITELSAKTDVNSGSFALLGPDVAGPNYLSALRGTQLTMQTIKTYTAPISSVISLAFDISQATSATEIKNRVNGAAPASVVVGGAADAGTGNFGNYPLFIGSRAGTILPFNGHLYSLIVRGAQSTDAQITSAETWVNSKTGAY